MIKSESNTRSIVYVNKLDASLLRRKKMLTGRRIKRWYLAWLIEFPIIRDKNTLKIINEKRPFYWENQVLIKAGNSETAYKKAIKEGRIGEYKTINTDGDYVEWKFAGIRELVEVDEDLEDGAEISYYEGICKNFKSIRKLIRPKQKLSIFEFELRKEKEKKKKKQTKIRTNRSSYEHLKQRMIDVEKEAEKALGDINKNI